MLSNGGGVRVVWTEEVTASSPPLSFEARAAQEQLTRQLPPQDALLWLSKSGAGSHECRVNEAVFTMSASDAAACANLLQLLRQLLHAPQQRMFTNMPLQLSSNSYMRASWAVALPVPDARETLAKLNGSAVLPPLPWLWASATEQASTKAHAQLSHTPSRVPSSTGASGKSVLRDRAGKLLDDVGNLLFMASPNNSTTTTSAAGGNDAASLLPADLWTTPTTVAPSRMTAERGTVLSMPSTSSSQAVSAGTVAAAASTSVLASHYQDLAASMMGLDDI